MTETAARPDPDPPVTTVRLRPRREGANIRTWIGFKHFMYLAEEAVCGWLRERDLGPQRLYHEYGLGVSVVDSSVLLPAVLEVDDEAFAEVTTTAVAGRFAVRLLVPRGGENTVVLRGKVRVALPPVVPGAVAPPELAGFAHDPGPPPVPVARPPREAGTFAWDWRVPYYYCEHSERLAHSGYVRAMEEVVDRFLADRGLSVGHMLDSRGWIPVVSRAGLRILAPVFMEETVHTTFTVGDVVKGVMYDARMDCHVRRPEGWVHTATGRILHGYAVSRGPDAGTLATLDLSTVAALTGSTP
jgi:acyl-CoA thioesterase FadM